MLEIRTVVEADRGELRSLFGRAGQGAPTESLWGHVESEAAIYLDPYFELEPESLFVAVLDGALVGYLAGCLDTAVFPSESERMERAIREHRLFLRGRAALFLARGAVDTMVSSMRGQPPPEELDDPRWPAHLHINVEPRARGIGAADGLMRAWQDRLRLAGSPGCFLQTTRENTRAVRFFGRMGFVPHGPTPPVPGIRYRGRRLHQRTMVWTTVPVS